ncbi:hypothetical protein LP21_03145 [Listeria monocytogenes]|nr:hypothetical protein [Listeria monocytogenes]EAD0294092.1 hypothetical protein [Listeria monocytogenes]
MNIEEQISNEQFIQVTRKIAFLAELKKYFYYQDNLSLDEVLREEHYYISELRKRIKKNKF